MTRTEAQNRATAKYQKKTYSFLTLRFRKDEIPSREDVAQAADAAGESLNGYIKQAIRERMERGY